MESNGQGGQRGLNSPRLTARVGPSSATECARCQVDGCVADLSGSKEYYRRHRVCEIHAKAVGVPINNETQRFCQQCSKFHPLDSFDDARRSCRRRLLGHNKRRRKAPTTGAEEWMMTNNPGAGGEAMADIKPGDMMNHVQQMVLGNYSRFVNGSAESDSGGGGGAGSFFQQNAPLEYAMSGMGNRMPSSLPSYFDQQVQHMHLQQQQQHQQQQHSQQQQLQGGALGGPLAGGLFPGCTSGASNELEKGTLPPAQLALLLPSRGDSPGVSNDGNGRERDRALNSEPARSEGVQPMASVLLRQAARLRAAATAVANANSPLDTHDLTSGGLSMRPDIHASGSLLHPGKDFAASRSSSMLSLVPEPPPGIPPLYDFGSGTYSDELQHGNAPSSLPHGTSGSGEGIGRQGGPSSLGEGIGEATGVPVGLNVDAERASGVQNLFHQTAANDDKTPIPSHGPHFTSPRQSDQPGIITDPGFYNQRDRNHSGPSQPIDGRCHSDEGPNLSFKRGSRTGGGEGRLSAIPTFSTAPLDASSLTAFAEALSPTTAQALDLGISCATSAPLVGTSATARLHFLGGKGASGAPTNSLSSPTQLPFITAVTPIQSSAYLHKDQHQRAEANEPGHFSDASESGHLSAANESGHPSAANESGHLSGDSRSGNLTAFLASTSGTSVEGIGGEKADSEAVQRNLVSFISGRLSSRIGGATGLGSWEGDGEGQTGSGVGDESTTGEGEVGALGKQPHSRHQMEKDVGQQLELEQHHLQQKQQQPRGEIQQQEEHQQQQQPQQQHQQPEQEQQEQQHDILQQQQQQQQQQPEQQEEQQQHFQQPEQQQQQQIQQQHQEQQQEEASGHRPTHVS